MTPPVPAGPAPPASDDRTEVGDSLYRHHLQAARHLAALARELENDESLRQDEDAAGRHRAYVIGAILSATAFLEASINELYLEVQELTGNGNRRRVLALPAHFWSAAARPAILHKYQLALVVADAEPFDVRRSPFRDAEGLVALRDALVHARSDDRPARHGVERRLRSKFRGSAFASPEEPLFPGQILGAGCAEWAVRVVERFSQAFCQRMAIPARG